MCSELTGRIGSLVGTHVVVTCPHSGFKGRKGVIEERRQGPLPYGVRLENLDELLYLNYADFEKESEDGKQ
jgi:hypothetical protein